MSFFIFGNIFHNENKQVLTIMKAKFTATYFLLHVRGLDFETLEPRSYSYKIFLQHEGKYIVLNVWENTLAIICKASNKVKRAKFVTSMRNLCLNPKHT